MASRTAIRRLATGAAVAAVMGAFVASAPAKPWSNDQYGNSLGFFDPTPPGYFPAYCNPSQAQLYVRGTVRPDGSGTTLFPNGIAWWDYFGVPFASSRFEVATASERGSVWGVADWVVPADLPTGRYGFHVLLQGNASLGGYLFWLRYVVTSLSMTTRIEPGLDGNCNPIAAASAANASSAAVPKPSRRVLAQRVRALRRDAASWAGRSLGSGASHPNIRFCARTICV